MYSPITQKEKYLKVLFSFSFRYKFFSFCLLVITYFTWLSIIISQDKCLSYNILKGKKPINLEFNTPTKISLKMEAK